MRDPHERLGWARKRRGFASATEAARRHHWNENTYRSHENGMRALSRWAATKYAKAFRVPSGWLLYGEGQPGKLPKSTQAVGYVGAGAQIVPIDDHAIGAGLEEVEIPPGIPEDAVLVIVRGDSMYPRYFEGEYLFYAREDRPPGDFVGRECIVQLTDGRVFVKVLRRGAGPSLFNLESWNAPTLYDQTVEWAAPVLARVNRAV